MRIHTFHIHFPFPLACVLCIAMKIPPFISDPRRPCLFLVLCCVAILWYCGRSLLYSHRMQLRCQMNLSYLLVFYCLFLCLFRYSCPFHHCVPWRTLVVSARDHINHTHLDLASWSTCMATSVSFSTLTASVTHHEPVFYLKFQEEKDGESLVQEVSSIYVCMFLSGSQLFSLNIK